MVLRPVHKVKLGRWRLDWRVGRYRWGYDFGPGAWTVVLPFCYVSGARMLEPE